jgi:hypothetical protein
MAEVGLLYGDREWFSDARSPFRRLAVSSHPEAGLVILSLWTADTCTATFRVPVADAARLISCLAEGLASGLPAAPDSAPTTVANPVTGWQGIGRRVLARFSRR